MNKRIIGRLLIVSAYLAVGFIAGCVAGADFIARPQQFLREMGDLGLLHEYAQIQYREAEYREARAAQEKLLWLLERAPSDQLFPGPRVSAFDKALTWGRIAMLDERAGESGNAESSWSKAERFARSAR